ncbi:hypothetical protein F0U61_53395 [Archangium violaceum]|uniref:hypothetical protein n=1 Tax=Archangium violaceum TaxID=83451 RepID=UPI002B2D0CE1|nr:hypothetical protein F0U61_53395 [Archangium violaceum]
MSSDNNDEGNTKKRKREDGSGTYSNLTPSVAGTSKGPAAKKRKKPVPSGIRQRNPAVKRKREDEDGAPGTSHQGEDENPTAPEETRKSKRRRTREPEPEPPRSFADFTSEPLVVLLQPCSPPPIPPSELPEPVPDAMEEEEEPPERWFYASAGKFEQDGTGEHTLVMLSVIDPEWFDAQDGLDHATFHRTHRFVDNAEVVLLTGRTFPDDPDRSVVYTLALATREGKVSVGENEWFKVKLSTEPPAMGEEEGTYKVEYRRQLPNLKYAPPETRWLVGVEDAAGPRKKRLKEIFCILASESTGQQSARLSQQVAFIGVFDIGQGSCSALFNADGHPFLYYDFGRAKTGFSETLPESYRPCLAGNPTVVLSHYDADHRDLAIDYPSAFHLPWLVLDGIVNPDDRNFFNQLTHVRVRPKNQKHFEEFTWGFLLRAWSSNSIDESNKNENGFVALVRIQEDPDAPPVGQRRALDAEGARPELFPNERFVLLTGDAMHENIASCRSGDLNGKVVALVAAHHGAQDGLKEQYIPLAAPPLHGVPPTVVYSYGIFHQDTNAITKGMHGYAKGGEGHPFQKAVNLYRLRGYHHRLDTATDISVTLLDTQNARTLVRHPGHGKATGDQVWLANSTHAAFNGGPYTVRLLKKTPNELKKQSDAEYDEDHYAIDFARGGVDIVATAMCESAITVLDRDDTECLVWCHNHGLVDGNTVNVVTPGFNGAGVAVKRIDAHYYTVPLSAGVATVDPDGTSNGVRAIIYDLPAGHSLVQHRNHGLAPGTTVTVSISQTGGAYDGGPYNVTVLDAHHYSVPVASRPLVGATPVAVAGRAGLPVTVLQAAAGSTFVHAPAHGMPATTPIQLRDISGDTYPRDTTHPIDVPGALADYFTITTDRNQNSATLMRLHRQGTPLTRRQNCLLSWRAPVGSSAALAQPAIQGYQQALARERQAYAQLQAAQSVLNVAEDAKTTAGNDAVHVANAAEAWMMAAAFTVHTPTEATRATLRHAIARARRQTAGGLTQRRIAAYECIHEAWLLLRQHSLVAVTEAQRSAETLARSLGTHGVLPTIQPVHCQHQAPPRPNAAPKLVPDPVVNAGSHPTGSLLDPSGPNTVTTEAVALLHIAAGECLVHHPQHGFAQPVGVTLSGAGMPLDGARNLTAVVDGDHYTLDATGNADRVFPDARCGVTVMLMDAPPGQCLVHHPGHNLGFGKVRIRGTGTALDGEHPVTALVDADHYRLHITTTQNHVNLPARLGGVDVVLEDDGAKCTIREPRHGRALNSTVTVSGTNVPALDTVHTLTNILDVDTYETNVTSGNVHKNLAGEVGAQPVTLDDDGTGCTVTHALHGRGLGPVHVTDTACSQLEGEHPVTEIVDANHYRLGVTTGQQCRYAAQVGGTAVFIDDDGTRCTVHHVAHGRGLETVNVSGSGIGALDVAHTITAIVDANRYRTNITTHGNLVGVAARVDNTRALLTDQAGTKVVITQRSHGRQLNDTLNVRNGGPAADVDDYLHRVIHIRDADSFETDCWASTIVVDRPILVDETRVTIDDDGMACTITQNQHGRGLGTVRVTGTRNATLEVVHTVTRIVDANSYETNVTTGQQLRITARVGGQPVLIVDDGTKCTVTHANHGRGLQRVTLVAASTPAYDGTFEVTEVVDPDHYFIAVSTGALGSATARVGGTAVTLYDKAAGTTLVRLPQHCALTANTSILITGTPAGSHDGRHTVSAVNGGLAALGFSQGVRLFRTAEVLREVTVLDRAPGHSLIRHRNHGLRLPAQVTLANAAQGTYGNATAAALNGAHAVAAVLDSNHYSLPVAHNATLVDGAITSTVTRLQYAVPRVHALAAGVAVPGGRAGPPPLPPNSCPLANCDFGNLRGCR